MPEAECERVQSNGYKYCVRYQNRSTGKWPVNYIQSQARGITLATGVYRRVRFRSCETVGYGPTMWFFFLIGAVTSCTVMIARHVREYHVSYVGNNVGTKGEGRREPFSCSLKRGGPIGKVLVHRWLPECHQQK